ncbi:MAG: hypothetical protein CMN76_12830 [Spirochaetaceae bacterium]|nr:hypothetical protein [Spirochaetaceae bacterium]
MAKVYGEVDSLKSLLVELRGNGIQFLNSLEDIEAFRGSYSARINAARVRAREALHREKERLKTVIKEQQSEIELSLEKQEELLKTELGSVGKQLADLEQIRKANKLVYILLRERTKYVRLFHDHWGQKRIQIRNVILMMNHRPAAEYEYVKIVLLERINRYIQYFEAQLSAAEVDAIAEILLSEMQNR